MHVSISSNVCIRLKKKKRSFHTHTQIPTRFIFLSYVLFIVCFTHMKMKEKKTFALYLCF